MYRLEKSDVLSPEAVIEGLHSILGHTVRSAEWADSTTHTGDVYHPAFGLLDEGEDTQGHIDDTEQIDCYHRFEIFYGEPVVGTGRH